MYKRKFEDDLVAVGYKKTKVYTDCPSLTLNFCKQAFQAAPELLKKRKRPEECEADSRDREARRIKSSHHRSHQSNPRILSPASKYQTFSKTDSESEEEKYWEGRTVLPRSSTPDHRPTSAAKETTTTPSIVLPIRLAWPQKHSPAPASPLKREKKIRKKPSKKPTQTHTKTKLQQQVPVSNQKQQQRNPKIPAQIQKSVPKTKSKPYYSSILEMYNATSDRFESDWVIR
ncbi:hypothetical protein V8C35DRAFT_292796 [Trichoderma chlorosporum]